MGALQIPARKYKLCMAVGGCVQSFTYKIMVNVAEIVYLKNGQQQS
ncbi:12443_t:CDS:2 [Racocetra fulgida]|uniref:12443_t:CDS:1 n=1 Tax=Racocetra fulgida TaxID=60492 RepID=A0A9N8YV30_9GLOM|nr:12443_t:CDS:2 [Racocetra fulgida]